MNGPDSCCPPPDGAEDATFLQALRPAVVQAWIERQLADGVTVSSVQPAYVRWKERDGSLIGYRVTTRGAGAEEATYVTVRTADEHRVADEASRIEHRADETHAGLRSCALVPDERVLLLSFPLDRLMPDLRRLIRASKVRTLIESIGGTWAPQTGRFSKGRSHWTLTRYKPERRAVVRWNVAWVDEERGTVAHRTVWIRCYADPHAVVNRAATAAARAAGVRCAQTLLVPHDRLLMESHLEGTPWSPGVFREDTATAAALACLHAGEAPVGLPVHGPLSELDRVLQAVEDLSRLRSDLGREAAAIADGLSHGVPETARQVLCHGDFHAGQVLIHAEGAGLCDFDRACLAPAALDLASLQAHCIVAEGDAGATRGAAFLEAYARSRPLPPERETDWWLACALLRAATNPFRTLRPDWPEVAAGLLKRAAAVSPSAHLLY